ncbi:Nucleolar protein 10 [Boothiomyces sp. JEL0838]|nr:Nucleolar protein 10 [Boothiomyces sp. JEL0838]
MQVSNANNIKIYSITSASKSAIPDWQVQRNKNKLKYDQAWRNRIELIQDFQFPEASIKLRQTRDGKFLMATGVYKPQIRVWDLDQMSMKFERHTNCENVTFEILSEDWTKSVHLQTDRTVEFHSHYGMHYQTRVPKFGRDLTYHYPSCNVLIGGASNEVWRLNLEQGRFMAPLETSLPEVNVCKISPAHQLFGFGGSNGKVEFWHPTEKKRIGILDVAEAVVSKIDSSLLDAVPEISSIEFGADGLSFMAGTSTGQIVLYDLRRPTPLIVKDHQYGYPIHSLQFHESGNVISSDTKIVKMWNKNDGAIFTNIEAPNDINHTCVFDDSGLIMLAGEATQIQSYYIPALGTAPKWCSFLDNITEELEENPNTTIYDDYKFVTRKELSNLGLDHLIGTNVLKAYMHGFFVDLRLYEKAKAIANPFEFDEYKKNLVQKKIEEKRASRISAKSKLPKVNSAIAADLLDLTDDSDNEQKKKKKKDTSTIMEDDRFKSMFSDPAFQVDTTSHEYKLHHPSESQTKITKAKYEPVQEDPDSEDSEDQDEIRFAKYKTKKRGPQMYELKDGFNATANDQETIQRENAQDTLFEQRLEKEAVGPREDVKVGSSGNLSITFNPYKKKKSFDGRERRSADSKRGRGSFRGRGRGKH